MAFTNEITDNQSLLIVKRVSSLLRCGGFWCTALCHIRVKMMTRVHEIIFFQRAIVHLQMNLFAKSLKIKEHHLQMFDMLELLLSNNGHSDTLGIIAPQRSGTPKKQVCS